MITKPSNWDSTIARGDYVYKIRLWVSYGNDFHYITLTDDDFMSGLTIDNRGYPDLSVGNISSTMIEFEVVDIGSKVYMLTAGATIRLYMSVKSGSYTSSEAYMGYFIIDNVVSTGNIVKVTAYDSINDANKPLITGGLPSDVTLYSLRNKMVDGSGRSMIPSSVYNNPRISSFSIPKSNLDAKNYKLRDVLSAFFAYGAYNVFLHPANSASNVSSFTLYEISNELSTTSQPLGEVCTVETLKVDESSTFITGVLLSNNNASYQSNSGWMLNVDMIDAVNVSQSMADSIFANLSSSIGSLTSTNIEVSGAEVSPLIENGDIVSIDNGDGTYTNFKIAGYRKIINGKCWCDLSTPSTGSNVTENTTSDTSSMTNVSYVTFNPTIEYLGNGMVKFGRYVLNVSGTAPTWVYNRLYASLYFGITYKKADGTQASTSSTACAMLVIHRYQPVKYDSATGKYYVDDVIAHATGIPSAAVEIVSNTLSLSSSNSNCQLLTK